MNTFTTDYLVIGSGAAGLAFVDTLLDETDAHITLVDRHGKPGGHWNDAYSFVTLHQPSAFYGVNSTALGERRKDTRGLNKGLYELASGAEVCGYYDRVMQNKLLPSGRVSYHPMCTVLPVSDGSNGQRWGDWKDGQGTVQFESLLSGAKTLVSVRKKLVDATFGSPKVPSTHQPNFVVAPGVTLVPPNALPQLSQHLQTGSLPRRFLIIGAGKTAMDAVVWLLNSGASADTIQWIMPRDSWLVNRVTTQPAPEFFKEVIGGQADQMEAFAQATSTADLFLRLEACGALMRIHPDHTPSMFHLATLTPAEAELLRSVKQVIRLGRVKAIEAHQVVLEHGQLPLTDNTLCIDCTASAIDVKGRKPQPMFQGHEIKLQLVRLPQPAFSAAFAAYLEAHYEGDAAKNRLSAPVPFPYTLDDYAKSMLINMWNQAQWGQDKELRKWVRESRLDGFGKLMSGADPRNAEQQAIMAKLKAQAMAAMANLPKLIASSGV